MQPIIERVSPGYFDQPVPRPFPYEALPNLIIDHLLRPGLRRLLSPVLVLGVVLVALATFFHAPAVLLFAAYMLVAWELLRGINRAFRRIRDELALIRYGLAIRAHILGLRPHRTVLGELDGAKLDCAIPVAPRRTYIGSIWLSDGTEAVALMRTGYLQVICLPRTPGAWRVIEDVRSDIRYERTGPIQRVPADVV
ncbi:MAG TPA: hypothetical protein VFT99_06050 [Roseiflexaceae bacterium]|nr:hypothetical protein [Roseiflexaceae bacterium]